ncbi:MAG: DUF927 domain-containing protein [Cellvibrionales bacterium]|nr:DUF927 domain-containing protein [Cellvibrionales bacterium]
MHPLKKINSDSITVLKSKGIYLTKRYDLDKKTKKPAPNAKKFTCESIEINTLKELFEVLKTLSDEPYKCVVNGLPVENWTALNFRNRETLLQRGIRFLPMDIDGIHVGEFNPNQCKPEDIICKVLDKLGLSWLSQYAYIWAWSSSVASPDWKGDARLRLWFELEESVALTDLKAWANPVDGLDGAIYSPCQIIYTAAPIYTSGGIKTNDPVKNRMGFAQKASKSKVPIRNLNTKPIKESKQKQLTTFERQTLLLSANEKTISNLKEALSFIPSDEYGLWSRIGLALSSLKPTSLADEARALWFNYSEKSDKYSEDETNEKWLSFSANTIDYRSVFNEAKAFGWKCPSFSEDPLEGFRLKPKGVYRFTTTPQGEPKPAKKICAPLHVLANTRDENSESWGRLLKWQDADKKEHQWPMPDTLLHGDYTELARSLVSQGLYIDPGAEKQVSSYISSIDTDKRVRCVDHLGWVENSFVLPNTSIGVGKEEIYYQSESIADHQIKQSGTLKEWQESISKFCINNSRLILAVCSALAAPTLALIEGEGGGFHFYGGSSTGKSTALQIAASVWGNADYVKRWRATSNGLEGIAVAHNDLLLVLDELSQLDPKYAGEIAYMLANGQGKQRAKKSGLSKKPFKWRNLLLSSGEITLDNHIQQSGKNSKAGQLTRIVDIPADAGKDLGLFEYLHEFETPKELADHLKLATTKSFGSVGIAWLEYLTTNKEMVKAELHEGIEHFKSMQKNLNHKSQVLRVQDRFAICAAAGEIASKAGLTAWPKGEANLAINQCFQDWLDHRGGAGNLEEQKLLTQVREFLTLHGESRFSNINGCIDKNTINRVGFRENINSYSGFEANKEQEEPIWIYYALPEGFKEIISGFSSKQAKEILLKRGWLKLNPDGSAPRTTLPGLGQVRCYILTSTIFD